MGGGLPRRHRLTPETLYIDRPLGPDGTPLQVARPIGAPGNRDQAVDALEAAAAPPPSNTTSLYRPGRRPSRTESGPGPSTASPDDIFDQLSRHPKEVCGYEVRSLRDGNTCVVRVVERGDGRLAVALIEGVGDSEGAPLMAGICGGILFGYLSGAADPLAVQLAVGTALWGLGRGNLQAAASIAFCDPTTGVVSACSSGHRGLVVVDASTGRSRALATNGPTLGSRPPTRLRDRLAPQTFRFAPGYALVLGTLTVTGPSIETLRGDIPGPSSLMDLVSAFGRAWQLRDAGPGGLVVVGAPRGL